ncbi:hypothetical protein BGX24_000498 [Mortierella sp. AD032]|nr:hypothetical protein BGX24_000498 [Mortierella sp. AD032]
MFRRRQLPAVGEPKSKPKPQSDAQYKPCPTESKCTPRRASPKKGEKKLYSQDKEDYRNNNYTFNAYNSSDSKTRVTKQKGEATSAKAAGKGGEIVQSDDGGTESDVDIKLVKTPISKTPRARTKVAGTKGGAKIQMERSVESGSDIKLTAKTPTPKKPRAKPKGRAIGDSPDGDAVNDGDNKLVKTPMPKKPRGIKLERGGRSGAGRAKTPTMPRKPIASRSKSTMKMSHEDPFTTKLPLVSPIHGGNTDDAKGSFPEGMPSKASPPRGSPMDGIETDKYVAATAMLELMTSNRDCEMMAMPQQERVNTGHDGRD